MIKERSKLGFFSSLIMAFFFFSPSGYSQNNFLAADCITAGQNPISYTQQVANVTFQMIQLPNPTGPASICSSGAGSTENTSWISFIAGSSAATFDLDIIINNCSGQISDGIEWGIVSDCSFTEVICDASCSSGPLYSVITSLIPGQQYWLWLDGCNSNACDFQLIFNSGLDSLMPCTTNVCGNSNTTISPLTDVTGLFNYQCIQGCMTDGLPATNIPSCGQDILNTVWYKVVTDANATQLFVTIETTSNWTPVFSIYNNTCANLSPVSSSTSPLCNLDWNNPSSINQSITGIDEYWIAVSAIGDPNEIIFNPDFEICVATTIQLSTCLGTYGGQCDDITAWELMASTNTGQQLGPITNIHSSAVPALCPGETVLVCGSFTYNTTPPSSDMLAGIIPILGDGWDLAAFNTTISTATANGTPGIWHDDGTPTAPILQEDVPHLCTYIDAVGNLQICNSLCTSCPCTPGMTASDPLPGGWFWTTNGGSSGCLNDGSPGEGWGIGTSMADVDFCFELTVRNNLTINDCATADLSVGVQIFSDGIAGCWDDPIEECVIIDAQIIEFNLSCAYPNYYADTDGDGYGDPNNLLVSCTPPNGFVTNDLDCDDSNASINPIAMEICDGLDNNCDGQIDEGIATQVYYLDLDMDGFGDPNNSVMSCFQAAGTLLNNLDCDDTDNTINPNATELCDGIDNNCDGQIDEGLMLQTFFMDLDLDGFGDPNNSVMACTQPAGTLLNDFDCNDNNSAINPNATEICDGIDNNCNGQIDEGLNSMTYYFDLDLDSFGDPNNSVTGCTQPAGTVLNSLDCNDNNAAINPNAIEICDGIDNNCDGQIDEGLNSTTYYVDSDLDGFGDPNNSVVACSQPAGTVLNSQDCNDNDMAINPTATELCDGIDNNCNGQIDEGLSQVYYFDLDMDGFGDPNNSLVSCTQPLNAVLNNQDCNDADAAINPSVTELCDGIDNDCDGQIDEGLNPTTYYFDNDMDGFGNPNNSITGCSQPSGYVTNNGDCDDGSFAINPNAIEVCDGIDNNCDGQIDEGLNSMTFYADSDMDGFGNPNSSITGCIQPPGTVLNNQDCNDSNAAINPNATEVCDGIDNNCNGVIDEGVVMTYYVDADMDGYGDPSNFTSGCTQPAGTVTNGNDCDDSNANINPGITEICDNIDNNCNGAVDEGFPFNTYYVDVDMDGYGDSNNSTTSCIQPPGTSINGGDCDDNDPMINPGMIEICDGMDNNCNDQVDEGLPFQDYFTDNDLDGYGDPLTVVNACAQPSGTVSLGGDCDDMDITINPGATDIPNNGIDEDCDGSDAVSATHELAGTSIDIYPNPTSAILNIGLSQNIDVRLELFSLDGKLVLSSRQVDQLDLSSLNDGVYLLRITEIESQKFVVERVVKSR